MIPIWEVLVVLNSFIVFGVPVVVYKYYKWKNRLKVPTCVIMVRLEPFLVLGSPGVKRRRK